MKENKINSKPKPKEDSMEIIKQMIFDLKRELQDKQEDLFDPDENTTDVDEKEIYRKCEMAIEKINEAIEIIVAENKEDLKCENRTTRGALNRCDYCSAFENEKCKLKS